ncbi:trehalose operon repressor [Halalkalibacter hemicellulosilyticus]|uniref:Trehalose operon repressor n=1 Tax=Halalkalibacter hemicellulosilyticusJCM 9152 TaxID=1236971 RepID=W4QG79_9BACI|nr:trehalose operon transcriptional repressor [Halalkalibacter hemicellulosilyticusJCM 9152]
MVKNKFQMIYEQIAKEIQNGTIKAGEFLPSEHELRQQYHTSRETVRKALKLLSEQGYIQKMQGKGSIVLDMSKFNFPISGLVSYKEVSEKLGHRSKTTVISLREIELDSSLKAEFYLDESANGTVWELVRVRDIDEEAIILDKDYLLTSMVPDLTEEISENSLYEYIESELGLAISFAKKEITVEIPTKEDRTLLDLEDYSLVVVVKSHVYLEDTTQFQLTESRHRPDKFRFVDFARRRQR